MKCGSNMGEKDYLFDFDKLYISMKAPDSGDLIPVGTSGVVIIGEESYSPQNIPTSETFTMSFRLDEGSKREMEKKERSREKALKRSRRNSMGIKKRKHGRKDRVLIRATEDAPTPLYTVEIAIDAKDVKSLSDGKVTVSSTSVKKIKA